jgi:hypothetical protein
MCGTTRDWPAGYRSGEPHVSAHYKWHSQRRRVTEAVTGQVWGFALAWASIPDELPFLPHHSTFALTGVPWSDWPQRISRHCGHSFLRSMGRTDPVHNHYSYRQVGQQHRERDSVHCPWPRFRSRASTRCSTIKQKAWAVVLKYYRGGKRPSQSVPASRCSQSLPC